jgi:hypothetical protein
MCGEHSISYELTFSLLQRIIPACAGSTEHVELVMPRIPRIRGACLLPQRIIPACAGSTVWNGAVVGRLVESGIIPACAGSTGLRTSALQRASSIRGSSPHVRGALDFVIPCLQVSCPGKRIIPACAGSTSLLIPRFF